MKAEQAHLLDVISKVGQFVVPIYQRNYSWEQKHCAQLWTDIERIAADDSQPQHFIGSIVYITKPGMASSSRSDLIDGQQRLATASLLLAVVRRVAAERDLESWTDEEGEQFKVGKEISKLLVKDNEDDDSKRLKLLPTEADRTVYRILIDPSPARPAEEAGGQLGENYTFFLKKVRQWRDLKHLYDAIRRLVIVEVSLEQGRDDPQLIFQSLNSTGLRLSQADLIRNHLLMGLPPDEQKKLYKNYWRPMEERFYINSKNDAELFDRFVRDYITLKTREIANSQNIYVAFKSYMEMRHKEAGNKADVVRSIVDDMAKYARYFMYLARESEPDEKLRQAISDLNRLEVRVAYPFLLEAYDDYAGEPDKTKLVKLVRLTESYVFRRAICNLPTNALKNVFRNLSKGIDKANYVESVSAALIVRVTKEGFPTDDEFRHSLLERDVYNFKRASYLLEKLEAHENKEPLKRKPSIEHIMPQNPNLSADWQRELGATWKDIQAKYLHRLGNLTLTYYNSELSDYPFTKKRTMIDGFASSRLWLSRDLAELTDWNEAEMVKRGQRLADVAVELWERPEPPAEMVEAQRTRRAEQSKKVYSVMDHSSFLIPELQPLFEQLCVQIKGLGNAVREVPTKTYIAYKASAATNSNFVDVYCQKRKIVLYPQLRMREIDDPRGLCRDVSTIGKVGNGDVEVSLASMADLDYVMMIVKRALTKKAGSTNTLFQ